MTKSWNHKTFFMKFHICLIIVRRVQMSHKCTYHINQVYAPPEWVGEHHYNGEALSVWELGTQHIFLKVQNL